VSDDSFLFQSICTRFALGNPVVKFGRQCAHAAQHATVLLAITPSVVEHGCYKALT
jgi:hypothetical protein